MIEVSTSVLDLSEKDFTHSVYNLETARTDYFHIDVMDGKFVENDTSARMLDYATTISHISQLGVDVHLMVNNPEEFIDDYIALKPSDDDYIYFYADRDGKLHFAKNYEEHQANQEKYRW